MGPGTTNGFNIVAEAGCPAIGAAKFFSPFPQLDVIDSLDPAYQTSYQKYNNGAKGDDIGCPSGACSNSSAPCSRRRGRT